MKRFFDTSVLVAAVIADHPRHAPSLAALAAARQTTDGCAARGLAEMYAVLTRVSGPYRFSGPEALLMVAEVPRRLSVTELNAPAHLRALERAAAAGFAGSVIFDFLIACCAEQSRAAAIYTWNTGDFARFAAAVAIPVRTPPA